MGEGERGYGPIQIILLISSRALSKSGRKIYYFQMGSDFSLRALVFTHHRLEGWSGSAMVLSKLPVPGRPTYLDLSRARAYCACNRCGWGLFGHFFSVYHFSFLSPSLLETARYRPKYCLKGPLSQKQPTNQPTIDLKQIDYQVC